MCLHDVNDLSLASASSFCSFKQVAQGFFQIYSSDIPTDIQYLYLFQGITLEHLEMLGPLICHTIRPLVFRSGLWTIELEKSWNHLFEMIALLMKRGYPLNGGGQTCTCPPDVNNLSSASSGGIFPSLTHTLILKDTWAVIVEQMHELGLPTFVKLFRLSANLR